MPAKKIVSEEQREIILEFMEENPKVAQGRACGTKAAIEAWTALTSRLNAAPGCRKSLVQWRDHWNCEKYTSRKNFARAQQGITEDFKLHRPLSDKDQQILAIIGTLQRSSHHTSSEGKQRDVAVYGPDWPTVQNGVTTSGVKNMQVQKNATTGRAQKQALNSANMSRVESPLTHNYATPSGLEHPTAHNCVTTSRAEHPTEQNFVTVHVPKCEPIERQPVSSGLDWLIELEERRLLSGEKMTEALETMGHHLARIRTTLEARLPQLGM